MGVFGMLMLMTIQGQKNKKVIIKIDIRFT